MKCLDTFRKEPYKHDCAMAVAYKYADILGLSKEEAVKKFSGLAAGRAPGAVCGALYVATCLLPNKADQITKTFQERVGAITCLDIKTKARTSCPDCVDITDHIIEKLK